MHTPHPAGPGPLARAATSPSKPRTHDRQTAELARYKLGRLTADDADGYHRVACPAVMGKIRCPLRPSSMTVDRGRPEVLTPPEHPQACCTQQTLTVSPEVNAKTAQKHDYPSAAHRALTPGAPAPTAAPRPSRTPPATTSAAADAASLAWPPSCCSPVSLTVVRNQRILAAWNARQQENAAPCRRRPPPKTRNRRRKTLAARAPRRHSQPQPAEPHPREHASTPATRQQQRQAAHARIPAAAARTATLGRNQPQTASRQHDHPSLQTGMSHPYVNMIPTEVRRPPGEVFTFRADLGNGVWVGGCPQVKRAQPTLSGGCCSGSAGRGPARAGRSGCRFQRGSFSAMARLRASSSAMSSRSRLWLSNQGP